MGAGGGRGGGWGWASSSNEIGESRSASGGMGTGGTGATDPRAPLARTADGLATRTALSGYADLAPWPDSSSPVEIVGWALMVSSVWSER